MTAELPDHYGRTELVLMVVDPFLLFAYWEVTPESLGQAQDALGAEMEGARAVLRFHAITRSNIVHTPRAGVSARDEERWMRVRFMRRRKPDPARPLESVPAPPFRGRQSPEELRALLERRLREQARLAAEFAKGTSPGSMSQGSR